jgi:translation elongation factor EF-1alpha
MASLEPKSKQGALEQNEVAEVTIDAQNPLALESFEGSNSLGRFILEKDREICVIGMIC